MIIRDGKDIETMKIEQTNTDATALLASNETALEKNKNAIRVRCRKIRNAKKILKARIGNNSKRNKRCMATFAGNADALAAIDETLSFTGDIIEELELKKPDGSVPEDDWAPAVFKPEAGMSGYDVRCTDSGYFQGVGEEIALEYNIPDGNDTGEYMMLEGPEEDIRAFCQGICDMTGSSCGLSIGNGDGSENIEWLEPEKDPVPDPKSLIVDVDELEW